MPDAEQDYPLHQHDGNGQHSVIDNQTEQCPQDDLQETMAMTPALPGGRVKNALIIGGLASILAIAQSIAITFVNAPTYHAYAIARDTAVKSALALTIFGYATLTFFITLIICITAGFIAGKVCVQRRFGFLAGFVVGSIFYAISFITRYLPRYPGNQQSSAGGLNNAGTVLGGIALFLAFLLVWGILTGLVSLLGAWIATRKHPFYSGYSNISAT